MSKSSIRSRFAISLLANILRGVFVFAAGLVVARGLGPADYGNLSFLLASFISITHLLDMGTSNAFYTFLSQKKRGLIFVAYYAGWQGAQFFFSLILIYIVLPDSWIANIWLGQSREWVVLAFMGIFMQHHAWKTMVHIGESNRMTHKVQYMNIAIATVHLMLVAVLWRLNQISVGFILSLVVFEYVVAIAIGSWVLPVNRLEGEVVNRRELFHEYRVYCVPLAIAAGLSFIYTFYDRWLLQYFGGPENQAFFSIGFQFSAVCLIATTSMSKIFWKEISEAQNNQDHERVRFIYENVSRGLFFLGAVLSGFLIPWSFEIVSYWLGNDYIESAPVLLVMFLFPVHQSLGQILAVMLLATSKTKAELVLATIMMAVNLPISYLVLAPQDGVVPGWDLGSLGVAGKMVIIQILGVNFLAWWIAREFKWKYDWLYQVVGLGGTICAGWAAYTVAEAFNSVLMTNIIFKVGIAFVVYAAVVVVLLWYAPWIAGTSRDKIKMHIVSAKKAFYR
jgi:O-antigen/teichoic acid export membrane protein